MTFVPRFTIAEVGVLYEEGREGQDSAKWTQQVSWIYFKVINLEVCLMTNQGELAVGIDPDVHEAGPNLKSGYRISGEVESGSLSANISTTRLDGPSTLVARRVQDSFPVQLVARKALANRTKFAQSGTFEGVLFDTEEDSGAQKSRLHCTISMPEEHLDALVERIDAGKASGLFVQILVPTFQSEMDGFLNDGRWREWHVLGPSSTAFSSGSVYAQPAIPPAAEKAVFRLDHSADEVDPSSEVEPAFPRESTLPGVYLPLLKSMRAALWAIFIALVILVLK